MRQEMTLDAWADNDHGDGYGCEAVGEHDTLFILSLPSISGYLVLNATTGVVWQAGWPRLVEEFGAEHLVKTIDFHVPNLHVMTVTD